MLSENAMRRHSSISASSLTVARRRKSGVDPLRAVGLAGACTAKQTTQVSDSVWLEWWWIITASADDKARIKHSHAAALASDRIPHISSDKIYPTGVYSANL